LIKAKKDNTGGLCLFVKIPASNPVRFDSDFGTGSPSTFARSVK
jgi:hypothetical protein